MGKIAITISKEGIQTLTFLGSTEDERTECFKIYSLIQTQLKILDDLVKESLRDKSNEKWQ